LHEVLVEVGGEVGPVEGEVAGGVLLRVRRSSRVTFHGTGGSLEVGILPESGRVYLPEARDGWGRGWTSWESSRFTTPFARTEQNTFSELPELDNIDFFRVEMGKFVDSIRTGAPVAVPVADALSVALVVDACYRSEKDRGANTPLEVST
jgi:predicted dehydrogenase